MTREEKQLLLKDLCARLPYNVKIKYHYKRNNDGFTIDEDRELQADDVESIKYDIVNPQSYWCEILWKPYLRPFSSMTNEEIGELGSIICKVIDDCCYIDTSGNTLNIGFEESGNWMARLYIDVNMMNIVIGFCNEHHFDYNGLIEKELALEAPEGMYNIKH